MATTMTTSTMYRLMIQYFSRTNDDASPVVKEYGVFRDRRNAEDTGRNFCQYEDYMSWYVEETTDATPDQWENSVDSWV